MKLVTVGRLDSRIDVIAAHQLETHGLQLDLITPHTPVFTSTCRAVLSTCKLAHPLFHLYHVVSSLALARWHILFFQCFVSHPSHNVFTQNLSPVALSRALKHFLAVLSSIRLMIALSVKLKVTVSKVFGSASFVCCIYIYRVIRKPSGVGSSDCSRVRR